MAITPEIIDFLGIKIPTTALYPKPVVKTFSSRKPRSSRQPDRFYTPLQEATNLFILKEGAVLRYQQTVRGFITPVELLVGRTFFGEEAFRGTLVFYDSFAEPLSKSTVTIIDRRLREQLYFYPEVRDRLEDEFGARQGNQGKMQVGLVTKSVLARLAGVLPMLATAEQIRGASVLRVLPITHEQLAGAIGSTRESVTKNLGELVDMGLVSSNGRGLLTLPASSLDQLRDLATEEKL